ncbi:MAG: hypothetical protein K8R48_07120 [Alphaproteobacteria bacterium]|nr:hypothetical protein [Alphaproteobacteria bacterium]
MSIKSFNELAAKSDTPLSLEKAIEIFDHLADMEDIAFGYAVDGCYARAHLMGRKMQEMGLTPKKAWAFEGDDKLTVGIDGQKLRWWFHVAPALSVQMPDGTVQDMVIDPSLFDGPVSLKEWGDIMKADPEKLQIAAFDAPPAGYTGAYCPHGAISDNSDEKAKKTMETYLNRQRTPPRKVFASESRQQVSQMQNTQSQAQGKTWVSIAAPETPTDTSPEKKARDTGWGFDQN